MPEVSGSYLASLSGKTWRTVKAKLAAAGIRPLRRERNADLFDSAAALAAIYAVERDAAEFDDQRQRLAAAQAEKHEMENAVRRGELAEVSQVQSTWADHIAAARAKLLSMPTKLGPQLTHVADPNIVAGRIRAEVYAAINELAAWEPPASDDESEGVHQAAAADLEEPAKPNGKPLGRRKAKAQ